MDPSSAMRWVLNLAPIPLAIVVFVTATVLFGSERFVEQLGFLDLRRDYRPWFGLSLLTSAGLLSLYGIRASWRYGSRQLEHRRREKRHIQVLADLSGDERAFLRRFIVSDSQTQEAEVDDGTANGLMDKGILFRPSGIMTNPQPFNLQPWAWKTLRADPDVIGTPADYEESRRGRDDERRTRW